MGGEGSPSPIYEGDDSVIAWLLAGKSAIYRVPLPSPGEPKRAILETYTKEHSVAYHRRLPTGGRNRFGAHCRR